MAAIQITALTALTTPADTDVLPIQDVGASATKKITFANLAIAVTASIRGSGGVANVPATTALTFGTDPATTGPIRLGYNTSIYARNGVPGNNNVQIAGMTAGIVTLGDGTQALTQVNGSGYVAVRAPIVYLQSANGAADIATFETTKISIFNTSAAPAQPTAGKGFLFVEAGQLKYRGPNTATIHILSTG